MRLRVQYIYKLIALFVFVALSPCATVDATTLAADAENALSEQKYLIWHQINQARQNPLAVMQRLGIPEQQARLALAEDAWVLDRGLPPLAWNDLLFHASQVHGRDMLSQVYYSHYSPDGAGPAERIAATGYQAVAEQETLGALIFDNYIELEQAVTYLLDNMMRDELTGTPGVSSNIFAPDFTEVGVSLFAENITFIDNQPYIFLLVIEFARPVEARGYMIVSFDPENRMAMRDYYTGFWSLQPQLAPGFVQLQLARTGADLLLLDGQNSRLRTYPIPYFNTSRNILLEMGL